MQSTSQPVSEPPEWSHTGFLREGYGFGTNRADIVFVYCIFAGISLTLYLFKEPDRTEQVELLDTLI